MSAPRRLACLVVALVWLASGCGSADSASPSADSTTSAVAPDSAGGGDAASVTIEGFAFEPEQLEIASGKEVVVVNKDDVAHTLTADDGSFDTGTLEGGSEGRVVVEGKGEVAYHCTFHNYMKGTFTVV